MNIIKPVPLTYCHCGKLCGEGFKVCADCLREALARIQCDYDDDRHEYREPRRRLSDEEEFRRDDYRQRVRDMKP